ncbi:U6 snRNA-associated Sm-like protein LSm7 [Rhizoctonia solani AG-1 IB]|uniref:U6 snRNA-associated Sm-like protein LSm7 n=1 Tax=Thanatephorus cucumeris (strain AG1-IB / isolate 7/3/14) TaxID=1108050 RepID=M5BN01_THACB|nr:U6 snRNA-associated Sm-like protein LSm7 [Rhizoctonia solani AG-1 IB]
MADRARGTGRGRGGPRGGSGSRGGAPAGSADKPRREAILDLSKYQDERIRVKFTGGRQVTGVLKGYDQLLNLVLDDVQEERQGIPHLFHRPTWLPIHFLSRADTTHTCSRPCRLAWSYHHNS